MASLSLATSDPPASASSATAINSRCVSLNLSEEQGTIGNARNGQKETQGDRTAEKKKSRAEAREDVADRWRQRRRRGSAGTDVGSRVGRGWDSLKADFESSRESRTDPPGGPTEAPVCAALRSVLEGFASLFFARRDPIDGRIVASSATGGGNGSNAKKGILTEESSRNLASTVSRIQRAAAVAAEVETYQVRHDIVASSSSASENPSGRSDEEQKSGAVSLLPAGYDLPLALARTSDSHSRAFLLLDLASIIAAHRTFQAIISGPGIYSPNRSALEMTKLADKRGRTAYVRAEFAVRKNRDGELLRLLVRLGVGLRCGCGEDLSAVREALRSEALSGEWIAGKGEDLLVDDPGRVRKPDGYYRRLLFPTLDDVVRESSSVRDTDCDGGVRQDLSCSTRPCITVDGPDEVRRVVSAVQRFVRRDANGRCRRSGRRRGRDPIADDVELKAAPAQCHVSHGEREKVEASQNSETKTESGQHKRLEFILALPSLSTEETGPDAWKQLFQCTHKAALESHSALVGVSVDLSPWWRHDGRDRTNGTAGSAPKPYAATPRPESLYECNDSALHGICARLRSLRLALIAFGRYGMQIDLTNLPYPLTRERASVLTSMLANVVSSSVTPEEVRHFLKNDGSTWDADQRLAAMQRFEVPASAVRYTADVGEHLVAHAGALCTRIIGARRDGEGRKGAAPPEYGAKGREGVMAEAAMTTHYYIDDGCYGSLGSSSNGDGEDHATFSPVPLYGKAGMQSRPLPPLAVLSPHQNRPDKAETTARNGGSPSSCPTAVGLATVWGPTCDGLDKVCDSVLLPPDLQPGKDWLVFPHLGCGGFGGGLGLGTAFNGFDPPDVAYCVLGYFSGGASDGFGNDDGQVGGL